MRFLIVSYDAGGAELLASWLAYQPSDQEVNVVAAGPARDVFNARCPFPMAERLPRSLDGCAAVICGSSATATLEKNAVDLAKAQGVKSVVWLDHWKNYPQRFRLMPDEVWVCDSAAAAIARDELGVEPKVVGNPYLTWIQEEVERLDKKTRRLPAERLLIVAEPGREAMLSAYVKGYRGEIRVRPHPSQQPPERPLAEDLSWSTVVVGFETMALVCAVVAGRKAISLLPDRRLPYPGIETAHV